MKKILFIINLIFIFGNVHSQSGWFQVSEPITNLRIMAIQFTSEYTGYASGSYNGLEPGAFLKTTNAGLNWQVTQFPFYSADDISFLDNNTGYFIGGSGSTYISYIFKTTNAGINWICKDSMQSAFFRVKFYDYNTGFIVAKYSGVYKTTNGGGNWITQTGTNWHEPTSLCCIDVNTWLVANNVIDAINKTTNGGINWNILNFSSIGLQSRLLYFINCTTGFSASYYGNIFKTTNTGDNWYQISNINSVSLQGRNMQFVNGNTGYICGYSDSGGIFKTTDGGYNWTKQITITNTTVYSINFINANTGFAGDYNGRIFKTINGGVSTIKQISSDIPSSYELYQNYPNPFNPSTIIKFQIPKMENQKTENRVITLKVFDILGKEVATLVNEKLQPGFYEVPFSISQFSDKQISSGVYFYRLQSVDFVETKRMMFLK